MIRITLLVAAGVLCLVARAPAAPARIERRPPNEIVRARPPVVWDKTTESAFFADAFATLKGSRPDFTTTAAPPQQGSPAAPPTVAEASGAREEATFRWSTLVSPDTLADEIKDMNRRVTAAVASASDFKGGGYDDARVGFGTIALAFAVIAAHDGDVRWRKDAAQARDLFARVGANCKVGTTQSFAEAKARVDDLGTLLDGAAIEATAERDGDFKWSQVAGRPALMARLEAADTLTAAAVASKADFTKQVEKLLHEVEMIATIGEVIQRPDYEYHDDETYRGHAAAMRDAAVRAREAAVKNDYDAARTAVGALKKSCDSCHGDYRG
ncbi:hypothetical protein EBR56_11945 [bacterium]|nr:hypothetical protein [bacterium]